jgi:hypothetical protein
MPLLCKIFGHKVKLDDVAGGTLFQVCHRKGCTWVGRCVYDEFADEATKAEIISLNKKHGCMKILN